MKTLKDGKTECNRLCAKCLRHCKQPASAVLVDCPRYLPRPFKVDEHRYDQLGLFDPPTDQRRRKNNTKSKG